MPACPGCGAPHPPGAAHCIACEAALRAARPLPPPQGPPLGSGGVATIATTTQITREVPAVAVETRTPPPVRDENLEELSRWTEDRRGRSPILPGLIGL